MCRRPSWGGRGEWHLSGRRRDGHTDHNGGWRDTPVRRDPGEWGRRPTSNRADLPIKGNGQAGSRSRSCQVSRAVGFVGRRPSVRQTPGYHPSPTVTVGTMRTPTSRRLCASPASPVWELNFSEPGLGDLRWTARSAVATPACLPWNPRPRSASGQAPTGRPDCRRCSSRRCCRYLRGPIDGPFPSGLGS